MSGEATDRFQKSWGAQRRVAAESELDRFDMMRNFPVYVPPFHLARFIAHYEIFKDTLGVPGSIVEVGVFHGSSLMTWAKLCEIFCPRDFRKTVFGFDTSTGFLLMARVTRTFRETLTRPRSSSRLVE
jgi:hypothetical protein